MHDTADKHIYLVRHGESRANATRTFEGGESPLTEKGVAQAQAVAARFEQVPLQVVLTSDMVRAQHTGRVIADAVGVPVHTIAGAHEQVRHPAAIGIQRPDPVAEKYERAIWNSFKQGRHLAQTESFESLRARANTTMATIAARPETHIALATHGNFIKFFTFYVLFGELFTPQLLGAANDHMRTKNTGITYFTLHGAHWQLRAWNDHAHLG